jgi:hypothetical protein
MVATERRQLSSLTGYLARAPAWPRQRRLLLARSAAVAAAHPHARVAVPALARLRAHMGVAAPARLRARVAAVAVAR